MPENRRSIVYIDGFNVYRGLAKPLDCKWVNLESLLEALLPLDDVQCIRYFTSRVSGDGAARQNIYLAALGTLPKVSVEYGRFKKKSVKCRVDDCPLGCEEELCPIGCSHHNCSACTQRGESARRYKTTEEKYTDVKIALQMLIDAIDGRCDRIVLVTGDSDLVPAVALIKERFPEIEVILYVPCLSERDSRWHARELKVLADEAPFLSPQLLIEHQFSPSIERPGKRKKLSIPDTWRIAPSTAYAEALANSQS